MEPETAIAPAGEANERLARAIHALPSQDAWDPRCRLGAPPPGAVGLDALCDPEGPALTAHLAAEIADCAGADLKVAAAYVMDGLSWVVGRVLGHLYLSGLALDLPAAAIALSARDVPWTHGAESGIGRAWTLHLDPGAVVLHLGTPGEAGLRARFVDGFTDLMRPLVEALHGASRLPRAALWRLAGDGLSGGILSPAMAINRLPLIEAEAEAIFRRKGHPLFARETRYVTLTLPEGAPPAVARISDTFRARGGCCRAYTWGEGSYCTSCVLRKPEEQEARWRDWLAECLAEREAAGDGGVSGGASADASGDASGALAGAA